MSSPGSKEKYIDSVVKRIQKEDKNISSSSEGASEVDVNKGSTASLRSSNSKSEELSSFCSSYKSVGNKKHKRRNVDQTIKNPTKKKKKQIPISVTKEEAEKELQHDREDWLKMDPAALGERCLAHLTELELQRSRCSNISGRVASRMKESRQIATEITKAMIEKLTTVGDVFSLRNKNFSLKQELSEIKRREQAQNKEISSLRKLVANLEREVRSLKEGFGPFPPLKTAAKESPTPLKKTDKKRRKGSSSPLPLQSTAQRQNTEDVGMDIEPLLSTSDCSTNEEYMNRKEWPNGRGSISWVEQIELGKTNRDIYNDNKAMNINTKMTTDFSNTHRSKAKSYVKSYDTNNITNMNTNKTSIGINKSVKPINKRIRVIEDIQLVPPTPTRSTPNKTEWVKVNRGDKRINTRKVAPSVQQSTSENRKSAPKSGRRLIKPAVVTITSMAGGATYAEILAKARDGVSLKDLGIQSTVIRRAVNGALIIEVPDPQGKQLAATLRDSLTEALGDEANVQNPVATGELRLRGIDPSTTTEDIYGELESLSGCQHKDIKVSPIRNMRDGMGIAWVTCPLQIAVRLAEAGVVALGWTRVKIELLRKRLVQCYKCWHFGHVRNNCRAEADRTGNCFKCGLGDHTISTCNYAEVPYMRGSRQRF